MVGIGVVRAGPRFRSFRRTRQRIIAIKAETLELYIISKQKKIASLELEIKQMNDMMQIKKEPGVAGVPAKE